MSKAIETKACYHCGETCEEEPIVYQEKDFCCQGCQTVYSILDENGLCNYYDIEQNPGISFKKVKSARFDYLDDEDIKKQLITFEDGEQAHVTFYIPQIHCYSCLWLLEKLSDLSEPILSSRVNYLKKEISIGYNTTKTSLKEVVQLLAKLGYEPKITLSDSNKDSGQTLNKKLFYKLGITFFCFGNIMMLSFPEYFSSEFRQLEQDFSAFFGYMSFALALPILFYGAWEYLASAWWGVKNKTINMDIPIALGIVMIFLVSSWEIFTVTGSGYFDSLGGLIFFLLLGKTFQQKTFDHLSFERDYKSYFPIAVTRKVNDIEENIAFNKITVGDRLVIHNEEIIPADCLLLNSHTHIDYSFVTGESTPIKKVAGEVIYAGGKQKGGVIEIEIIKPPSQSYLTQLWNNHQQKNTSNSLDLLSNKVSKYFTIVVLAIAVLSAIYWLPIGIEKSLHVFASILIIACPCALALSIPFTMGNAVRILGNNKFYLKNLSVIEDLTNIKHLVFDKTGTLTEVNKSNITFKGTSLSEIEKQSIYSLVKQSNHPLSNRLALHLNGQLLPVSDYKEQHGLGLEGVINGAEIKLGSAIFLDQPKQANTTEIHVSINKEYKGFYALSNVYREGIDETIQTLKAEYQLSVLSGDSSTEKANLEQLFGANTTINFNQSPFDKLEYIKALQCKGENTIMLGDGLNDAGALEQSNVGIAITDQLSNFTPSSDVIMEASMLPKLHQFIRFAKASKNIVILSFTLSFMYNCVGLYFSIGGTLSPLVAAILMPLSSISVMLFTTLATTIAWKWIKN